MIGSSLLMFIPLSKHYKIDYINTIMMYIIKLSICLMLKYDSLYPFPPYVPICLSIVHYYLCQISISCLFMSMFIITNLKRWMLLNYFNIRNMDICLSMLGEEGKRNETRGLD
jgi:hypothetical protein